MVCEAFGCVPSVAERELDQHHELVFAVLDARFYGQAYHRYHDQRGLDTRAKRALLREPMIQAVQAIAFELRQEDVGERDSHGGDEPDHTGVRSSG